jgi:Trk K+ transport system NAD-binding subunit
MICFLGAGALGSTLGGVLTEVGNEVWLIDRNAAQVETMKCPVAGCLKHRYPTNAARATHPNT